MRSVERSYVYPLDVLEEADGITVTCPDVPEMVTGGWGDLAANLDAAEDALVTVLSEYVERGRRIPDPSPPDGRPVAVLPPLVTAKLLLHEAMLAGGVSNLELANRLGVDEKAIRRLRDPMHRSHIGAVDEAFHALGWRLVVSARTVSAATKARAAV
jgi:antitoxin HicB